MQLTGAEIVVECLKEQGVDTVFGYPGGTILNVYDALYKHSDEIRHVLTSHEQGYLNIPRTRGSSCGRRLCESNRKSRSMSCHKWSRRYESGDRYCNGLYGFRTNGGNYL